MPKEKNSKSTNSKQERNKETPVPRANRKMGFKNAQSVSMTCAPIERELLKKLSYLFNDSDETINNGWEATGQSEILRLALTDLSNRVISEGDPGKAFSKILIAYRNTKAARMKDISDFLSENG